MPPASLDANDSDIQKTHRDSLIYVKRIFRMDIGSMESKGKEVLIGDNEEVVYAEEEISFAEAGSRDDVVSDGWKIMLVDDEHEIHDVTKLALSEFIFDGRGLTFISAYNAEEAMLLIKENPDVSVILLDVVMETDDAGLRVAKYIREDLGNRMTRIVLRTGQPGVAPEEKVIVAYDINDYKEKTELTRQKLFTTVVSSLRSYSYITSIDNSRNGLIKIIEASSSIFKMRSLEKFVTGVLDQLVTVLQLSKNSLYCQTSGFQTAFSKEDPTILTATGVFKEQVNKNVSEVVPQRILEDLKEAVQSDQSVYYDDRCVLYFHTLDSGDHMIYLEGDSSTIEWDKELLELFRDNIGIAFENVYEFEQMKRELKSVERNRFLNKDLDI